MTDNLLRGVVTVTIKEARKLYTPELLTSKGSAFVKVGFDPEISKRTRVVPGGLGAPKWDETKHIPTFVSPMEDYRWNYLHLDVFSVVISADGTPVERNAGSLIFHVHDIIRKAPVSGWFGLHQEKNPTGELQLEFSFAYGAFGFNFSAQLLEDSRTPESRLKFSLYPSVKPPPERMETDRATLIPRALPHPSFIPFGERVSLGFGQKIKPIIESSANRAEEFPVLSTRLERLSAVRRNLVEEKSRASRLSMLMDTVLVPHRAVQAYRDSGRDDTKQQAAAYSSFVIPADRADHFAAIRQRQCACKVCVTDIWTAGLDVHQTDEKSDQRAARGTPDNLFHRIERRLSWFQSGSEQK